jgi:hypothetical protein
METAKKVYTSPKLIVHGNIELITKGFNVGTHLDAPFNQGTPKGDITFS